MKNLKTFIVKMFLMMFFFVIMETKASAMVVYVCFYYVNPGGSSNIYCHYLQGTCVQWWHRAISCEIVDPLLPIDKKPTVFREINGRAFLGYNGTTTPILSDAGVKFFKNLDSKYARFKGTEEEKQKAAELEILNFFKKDDGFVSKNRFKQFCKSEGLQIISSDGKSTTISKN